MRPRPTYRNPFSDAEEVLAWANRYLTNDQGKEETFLAAGRQLISGVDLRGNLREVYRWKLESFFKRFPWVSEFPDKLENDEIENAVAAARTATLNDHNSAIHAVKRLDRLRYVGVPVASAILASMHPHWFTVIDRRAYRALAAKFRDPIPPEEYLEYSSFCLDRATEFDVSLRQYDQALWEKGKGPRQSARCC